MFAELVWGGERKGGSEGRLRLWRTVIDGSIHGLRNERVSEGTRWAVVDPTIYPVICKAFVKYLSPQPEI